MPLIREVEEVTAALSTYNIDSKHLGKIAKEVSDKSKLEGGVTIKSLLLCAEIAKEKNASKKVEYAAFIEAFDSIM